MTKSKGFEVIDWIQRCAVHPAGPLIGQPVRLLPWEKKLLLQLFELRDDGRRRYRWAYISVPKKQGKTSLIAWIALYLLIGDETEPAPAIACAAASDEQADLVFGSAATVCKMSPVLSQVTEVFEREILVPSRPGARLRRVAAAAGTNDGQNLSAVLLDELHEWTAAKSEQVWTILTNSTAARLEPLILQITTAGFDLETVCGRQYEHAKAVASGANPDPAYLPFVVEAPDRADWKDPATWRAANPSFGITTSEEFYRDMLTKKTESVFRRYFLNQWVEAEDLWLPAGAWDACRDPAIDLDPKLPVIVGIDLGLVDDSTAAVTVQYRADIDRVVVRAKGWANPYPRGHSLRDSWRFDVEQLREYLRQRREAFPIRWRREAGGEWIHGPLFAFDAWAMQETVEILSAEGLDMVEVPQTPARLVPMSRVLYDLVVSGRLAHDGDPVLAQHIRNVVAKPRGSGWWLDKPRDSSKKIDMARALQNALTEVSMTEPLRSRAVGAFWA